MSITVTNPRFYAIDTKGNPLVGGQLHIYATGTTTPITTYADSGLTVPNTNPVILDEYGSAMLWVGPVLFDLDLYDETGLIEQPFYPVVGLGFTE